MKPKQRATLGEQPRKDKIMILCQKNFLLNRTYNETEDTVTYFCDVGSAAVKVDCSKGLDEHITELDANCMAAIKDYCPRECKRFRVSECNEGI